MLKIVRIVGIAALVFTGLVLASIKWPVRPLRLGITQDREAREFLQRDSAVTRFNSRQDSNEASANQDKDPPLVKQAQMLEDILNPRVAQAAAPVAPPTIRGPTPPVQPLKPTAKFDLVGISYSPSDPANSFAYIRLPDNTFQWIHPGSEIGHLVVKQVKNNSIICSDGQRMNEMTVEPAMDTASMLETGAKSSASDRITAGSPARLTGQDEAGLTELVHRLKQELQKESKSNQADSNAVSAEKAAAIGKLITEAKGKGSQVGAEEAQNLEKLGEKLNGAKDNPVEAKRRELLRRMSQPRSPKQ